MKQRNHFQIARQFAKPEMFVFLDETGVKTNMTRLYGWAIKGKRCLDDTKSARWKTQTLISAITAQGVLKSATLMIDGSMNQSTFLAYIQYSMSF